MSGITAPKRPPRSQVHPHNLKHIRDFFCLPCSHSAVGVSLFLKHFAGEEDRAKCGCGFNCRECNSKFQTPQRLERHLKKTVHMRSRAGIYFHDDHKIDGPLSEVQSLQARAEVKRSRKGMFIATDTLILADTGQADSQLEGWFLCRPCELLFRSANNLATHLESGISYLVDGTRFSCQDYERHFNRRSRLLGHIRSGKQHMRIKAQGAVVSRDAQSIEELQSRAKSQQSDSLDADGTEPTKQLAAMTV
jgi:hypothetical protein